MSKSPHRWLWIILLVLLVLGAMFWFAKPLSDSEQAESTKPVAQSTEWAPEPEGSAVPVTLPTTPLRNAPAEPRDDAREAGEDPE